jgi:hypothetical protein
MKDKSSCDHTLKAINSGKGEKSTGGSQRGAGGMMYEYGARKTGSSYAKAMNHRKKGK